MAEITHLPDEIIVATLENKCISITDIINFKSTCKRFQSITLSNIFWKKKIYQGCPIATKKYYIQKLEKIDLLNFEKQLEEGIKFLHKLHYYIQLIYDNILMETAKKELEHLLLSVVKNSITYNFVLDELNRINSMQLLWPFDFNLTIKYYFDFIFNCLIQYRFIFKQTKFITKPIKKQLTERQFTIVAQYFQSCLSYSVIKTWLDDIVEDVLLRLKIEHPSHSIFSTSSEQFLFWKTNNIYENYWDLTESKQIINTLQKFIFSHLGINKLFRLLSLIIPDSDAKYKNFISKYFLSYVLTITYQTIARRLGVCCILMPIKNRDYSNRDYSNFPDEKGGVKIVWKPKYPGCRIFLYIESEEIDTLNIVRERYCEDISPCLLKNGRLLHILVEMLQLFDFLQISDNITYKWNLKIVYRFLINCSTEYFRENIITQQNIFEESQNWKHLLINEITRTIQITSDVAVEKHLIGKTEVIKYAVGKIVAHQCRDNTKKRHGVIVDWHYKYDEMFLKQLKFNINVLFPRLCQHYIYKHKYGDFSVNINQPHYIILTANNGICYVPQNHISMCPPKEIKNTEIGRFFHRFEGTHYIPNKYLSENDPRFYCNFLINTSKLDISKLKYISKV